MAEYLKSKQEYVDRYDRITVEDCRWREDFHKNFKYDGPEKIPPGFGRAVSDVALHYDLLYTTLKWWEKKDATIAKWMADDEAKDRLLETTPAPDDIRCLNCLNLLESDFKDIYGLDEDGRQHVIFMYDCKRCNTRRAFFDNGEEYRSKPLLCSKCETPLEREDEEIGEKIITTYRCPKCGHAYQDEIDLSTKEKQPDPDYEKDRVRFCLSQETARKNLEERHQLEEMGRFVDEMKEKEKYKDEYDEIKKLQKLTVVDLEKLLAPALEKNGYIRLQFGTPEMGRNLFLPFTVQDSQSARDERESPYQLNKLVKKTLEGANWRIMSEGVSYRVGFLSGRLRAYEGEDDLLELARQRLKKTSPYEGRD